MRTADFDNRTSPGLLDDSTFIRSMKDKSQKIEAKLDENLEFLKRNSRRMDEILKRNKHKKGHSTQMTSATTRAKPG